MSKIDFKDPKMIIKRHTIMEEKRKNVEKILMLLSHTITYVSHPSVSPTLKCTLDYKKFMHILKSMITKEPAILINGNISMVNEDTVEALLRSYITIQFERHENLLVFKELEALKILFVLIVSTNKTSHPLYPCYREWIKGKNSWMEESMKLLTFIKD